MLSALIGPEEHRATKQTLGGPWDDGVAQWFGGSVASSGVQVDNWTALNYSAVFRAVRVISGTVSRLPIGVYRRTSEDTIERVRKHPVEWLLNTTVNGEIPSIVWRESQQAHLLTWGNCYSGIQRNNAGQIKSLIPKSPQGIGIERVAGQLVYEFKDASGAPKTVGREDMLHIPGLGFDGIVGYDVVHMARECIGLGIAAQDYGATFYGNSARPGGLLEHPGRISKEAATRLRETFNAIHQGPKSQHKVGILEEGMKWQETAMPNDSAQFLETRKFQVVEICRWFDVAPHLLFELDRSTNNNIEHQGLEFLIYSLAYWLARWEAFCSFMLFTEEEQRDGLFLRHDVSEVVRADIKARSEANKEAILGGWKSINEVRAEDHLNPIGPEGDMHLVQQQNVPVERIFSDMEGAKSGKNAEKTEPEPLESQEDAATKGKTAQTGLQGQQITALIAITDQVSAGSLPKPAAKAMIRLSFPLVDASEVNSLVDSLEIKPPPKVEAAVTQPASPIGSNQVQAAIAPRKQRARKPKRPEKKPISIPEMRSRAANALKDVMGRILRREETHLRSAAKNPRFFRWAEDWYRGHESVMTSMLEPVVGIMLTIEGSTEDVEVRSRGIAQRYCKESQDALLAAGDGNPSGEDLASRVDVLLAEWKSKRIWDMPEMRSLALIEPPGGDLCPTDTE